MGRSSHPHYVIIGNGASTFAAIQAIHQLQPQVHLEIFSNEAGMTYFPSALGRFLGSPQMESLFYLTDPSFYERYASKLYLDSPVECVDVQKQRIQVKGKSSIPYDKLLIATGVSPKASLAPISCIANLKEFHRWKNILMTRQSIAVEGDDLETLCWASHLIQRTQAKIFYFSSATHFLPSILESQTSEWLEQAFLNLGGQAHFQTTLQQIHPLGKQLELLTNNKRWKVDFLMQSSQWVPNVSFLPGVSEHLEVNSRMETRWPNVYAAGAVTQINGVLTPRLFSTALRQGEIAGKNMAGLSQTLSHDIPINSTEWFRLPVAWFGETLPQADHSIIEQKTEKLWKRLFLKNQRITGAFMLGDSKTLEMFYSFAKNRQESFYWNELSQQDPKNLFSSEWWNSLRNIH